MRWSPSSCAALVAALALAGCVGPGPAHAGALSCVGPCESILPPGSGAPREPALAVDPQDARHVVAVATIVTHDPAGDPRWWNDVLVSRDGGATWNETPMPGGPSAPPTHPLASATDLADGSVAFLPDGTLLVSGMAWNYFGKVDETLPLAAADDEIFVARSADGGASFPDITIVDAPRGGLGPAGYVLWSDKPWLATGADGAALLAWERIDRGAEPVVPATAATNAVEVLYARSMDGGRSWSAPVAIANDTSDDYWGACPLVARDGAWMIAYLDWHPKDAEPSLVVARSADRGASWTRGVAATNVSFGFPELAQVAGSGRIYASFATAPSKDAESPALTSSDDGGAMWRAPVLLDRADQSGAFIVPALAVLRDGTAIVGAYHYDAADKLSYRYAAFKDGATSALTVSNGIHGPQEVLGRLGDYMGLAPMAEGAIGMRVIDDGQQTKLATTTLALS